MEPLTSSHEAYSRAFEEYQKHSRELKVVSLYCYEGANHVMQKMSKTGFYSDSRVFRVLGVGSGDGKRDIEILTAVAQNLDLPRSEKPTIEAFIVEPSPTLIADFKRAVSPLPEALGSIADVSFDFWEGTFEQYIESSHETDLYDIVHFIGSLYYVLPEQCLKNCYKRLAVGGAMFCLLGSEGSFFSKVSETFQGKLSFGSVLKFWDGETIATIAKKNNWEYEVLPKASYAVDITSCYEESGGLLLDFLTHQIDFRANADPALYQSVIEFLTEESITCEQGTRVIKVEFTIVVIYK